jgi:heme-degrading monooxygenase HmoA
MHLVRTDFSVRAGYAAEFEESRAALVEACKGQPGYLGHSLLRSYSHPAQYTMTSRFENAEAAWALSKSAPYTSFQRNQTAGTVTVLQQEAYDSVFDVDAEGMNPASTSCEVLVDWVLDPRPGVSADFEQSRREIAELRKKAKGFASLRLRRSAGSLNRYLVINFFDTIDNARAAQDMPEMQAFAAAHPYTRYSATPNIVEAFHVVHRLAAR